MSKIWLFIMLIGISVLTVTNPDGALNAMLTAGTNAVTLTISLLGIYAIWLGVLGIVEQTGLSNIIASLLSPVIDFLFGKTDKETKGYLALNMSANILGLGNACTPMGIKAMQGLDKQNTGTSATVPMIMLMVINATSIQLLPTTVMGMRVAHGSATASDIIIPTILATAVSTAAGIALVKICAKIFNLKDTILPGRGHAAKRLTAGQNSFPPIPPSTKALLGLSVRGLTPCCRLTCAVFPKTKIGKNYKKPLNKNSLFRKEIPQRKPKCPLRRVKINSPFTKGGARRAGVLKYDC